MEIKVPMKLDLSDDPRNIKRNVLQSLINNHAINRSYDNNEITCVDDAGNNFRIFRLSSSSSLWHIV